MRAEFERILDDFSRDNAPLTARIAALAPSTGGPSETPADDPFVLACQAGLSELGEASDIGGLVVNCDMTTFRGAGIPTVCSVRVSWA